MTLMPFVSYGKMFKIAVFILTSALLFNAAVAQEVPLKFSYLTVDNGLSHTDAKDICQDKLGYIWIATLFGIDRFDGYDIKKYYNNNDPKNNAFKNRVRCIVPDDGGRFWLGTDGGIQCFDSQTEKYTDYKTSLNIIGDDILPRISRLGDNLLAAIVNNQFYLFKIKDDSLISLRTFLPPSIRFNSLLYLKDRYLLLSSEKGIWILNHSGTPHHLLLKNASGDRISNIEKVVTGKKNNLIFVAGSDIYTASDDLGYIEKNENFNSTLQISSIAKLPEVGYINDCIQDSRGNYYIATEKGLYNYSENLRSKRFINNASYNNALNINYLDRLFIDKTGCLWICTYGGGVDYCDLNTKPFYTIQNNPKASNTLSGNFIRVILEENVEKVWIGTNENGLNCYDLKSRHFIVYDAATSNLKLKSNLINALTFDKQGDLWVGTDHGLDIISKDRRSLLKPAGIDEFPNAVVGLNCDTYGNIWFCDYKNLLGCITYDTIHQRYRVQYKGFGKVIWADKNKGELLVGGITGITRLLISKSGDIQKSFHYTSGRQSNALSSNYTWPIKQQNDSTFWIGTLGGALDRLTIRLDQSYVIKTYGKENGIFNDVESMEIDNDANIWMGGNGLDKFNSATHSLVKYDKNDGLQGNSFKFGASAKGTDGKLYFGGINGLNYFYPDSIQKNLIPAHPVITDLMVNNAPMIADRNDSNFPFLPRTISYDKEINLNYLQNNFTISFSGMHFANPLKCKYRYRLVGFDPDWMYTDGAHPTAAYNNLDYQSYKFMVEASNNDGLWSRENASLIVLINPPWWKSATAKIIYLMLILSGLSGIYIYQARWYRLKREFAVRSIEEKKREEMHLQKESLQQQQLQFFTNISHEFRTPLTLIIGPLEKLVIENESPENRKFYELMYRNAKRLNNLINELMNFRKVAESAINLKVAAVNVNDFVTGIYKEFEGLGINHGVRFNSSIAGDFTTSWLDRQVTEKIIFNLLNNAFKYTDPGGEIHLDVFFDPENFSPKYESEFRYVHPERADNYIYISVSDTGIGISGESIAQIFDRYYRVGTKHLGSGIGLALVKSLTILHKGDIYVSSERFRGTEIVIALPRELTAYEEFERSGPLSGESTINLEPIEQITATGHEIFNDHPETSALQTKELVLIVEDNQELRNFLKNILQQQYRVLEAADGRQGLDLATTHFPDLIISDVMMPVMNGVELCRSIKQQFETSHIPFVMLSAKDALEAKLEGLESGADFYFSKPLSTDFLLLTIQNLFDQKQKLKLRYTRDYYAEATELVHSAKDKEFIEKLIKLIDENIDVPDLDVDYICDKLFTSRSKLYQKIKNISGLAIGDFIRTARLKKAVHLMTHEDITINELIERVGFTSTSYFSKAFKKEFGHSPSHFLKSIKILQLKTHVNLSASPKHLDIQM
jgi:signal transduction histidine kinase/ligand-binding sensor domain-containing protein/AraC-like DNA-binding protein